MQCDADAFAVLDAIWRELSQASEERNHAWRTPVLATVGPDGSPQARTVVLRGADRSSGTLQCYTDRRSPKVTQLHHTPSGVLVFWSKQLNWQLRVQARFTADSTGDAMLAAWNQVRDTAAAKDYLTHDAPGDPLSDRNQPAPQAQQLAVLTGEVLSIDWLELGRESHRRAVFDTHGVRWLTP
jgi:hypothetical protein